MRREEQIRFTIAITQCTAPEMAKEPFFFDKIKVFRAPNVFKPFIALQIKNVLTLNTGSVLFCCYSIHGFASFFKMHKPAYFFIQILMI